LSRCQPIPAPGRYWFDENLLEGVSRAAEDRGDLAPQGIKKRWKRRGLNDGATVVVVAVAEAHHLAVRKKALKIERLEREIGKFAPERLLLVERENVRMIPEPRRQSVRRSEQIGLSG
jgi:hypothetical protein